MTTASQGAGRFALDEDKAAGLVARNLNEHYAPGREGTIFASATAFLVHHAIGEGAITDPLHLDAETLAIEIFGDSYRWLLSVSTGDLPDDYITLASPACELDALTQRTGRHGAMDVLREAVTVGNMLAAELDAYVSSLPLSVRAPEIGELLAQLPAGEWGSDELGTLANWLTEHGYDVG